MKDPNEPNEFPSFSDPLPTNYERGSYPPDAFGLQNDSEPPVPATAPPVVGWYKVYAGVMLVLYFACMVGGFMLLKYSDAILASAPGVSPEELKIRAVVTAVIGIVLFVAFLIALVLPKSPGAWIYHLVLIAIGLSSCCFWPATIPLMIFWLKAETQRWFGRGVLPPRDPNIPPPPIPSA